MTLDQMCDQAMIDAQTLDHYADHAGTLRPSRARSAARSIRALLAAVRHLDPARPAQAAGPPVPAAPGEPAAPAQAVA